jgi:membrane associated rhomboid family serine protease
MNLLDQMNNGRFHYYWSYFIALLTIFLFIAIQNAANWEEITPEIFARFGAPYAKDIFDGSIWGMFTNSFIHNHLWHLFLSIVLFVFLGVLFEKRNKTQFFLLFILISSFVTSTIQLAMTGDPGIGLNGVNFALLTYLLVQIKSAPKYKKAKLIIWLGTISSLVLSILNIHFEWYYFGTSTIVTGLIIGCFQNRKIFFYSFQVCLCVFCSITLFYNPYSSEWNTVQGSRAFEKGEIDRAEEYYLSALELHPRNFAAKKNLVLIEIDRLQERAYYAHAQENYRTALLLYIQILNLDKHNSWAKKNLDGLP